MQFTVIQDACIITLESYLTKGTTIICSMGNNCVKLSPMYISMKTISWGATKFPNEEEKQLVVKSQLEANGFAAWLMQGHCA